MNSSNKHVFGCLCYSCSYLSDINRNYYKYNNPDPSTAEHARKTVEKIMPTIYKQIDDYRWDVYKIGAEATLAVDHKNTTIRLLDFVFRGLVAEIDRFEAEKRKAQHNMKLRDTRK